MKKESSGKASCSSVAVANFNGKAGRKRVCSRRCPFKVRAPARSGTISPDFRQARPKLPRSSSG